MKKFKEWWKKLSFWKTILIGTTIGFFVGILFFIIGFIASFHDIYYFTIGFPFIIAETIGAKYFGYSGWNRLTPHIFGGLLIYILFGLIISLIIFYFKKRR